MIPGIQIRRGKLPRQAQRSKNRDGRVETANRSVFGLYFAPSALQFGTLTFFHPSERPEIPLNSPERTERSRGTVVKNERFSFRGNLFHKNPFEQAAPFSREVFRGAASGDRREEKSQTKTAFGRKQLATVPLNDSCGLALPQKEWNFDWFWGLENQAATRGTSEGSPISRSRSNGSS